MPDGSILEANYMSSGIKNDAVYNAEGLVQQIAPAGSSS